MRRVNVNVWPKSGYTFRNSDGTVINGESWKSVIARVKAYRKRNNLPEGNADVEVHEAACRMNPTICTEETPEQAHAKKVVSIKSRLLIWLGKKSRENKNVQLEYVSSEEATRRADICASCPFNTAIPDGCASCRATLKELRQSVVGMRVLDKRVIGCLVSGEDLPSAVWLNSQTADNPELPPHCWRKRA